MSAYLQFFELEQSPFEGKAQAQVVLGTRALRDAFAAIRAGLEDGASRICVNGERGLGKTSLARALPKLLGESATVAVIRDPGVPWESLRSSLAKQWRLGDGPLARRRLVKASENSRLVVVVDQAEGATEEFLDHLDVLLSYRSEADEPVVQSVLLARLTTDEGEAPAPILWWLDRIQTLQLEFAPLPREGMDSYIQKHLKRAGWRGDRIFTSEAALAIHGYTAGIPGEVSSLCEKLLAKAAAENLVLIDAAFVHADCDLPIAEDETIDGEEPWTIEDEFEALALEEEFSDAGEDEAASFAPDSDESPFDAAEVDDPQDDANSASLTPTPAPSPTLTEALDQMGDLKREFEADAAAAAAAVALPSKLDLTSGTLAEDTRTAKDPEPEVAAAPIELLDVAGAGPSNADRSAVPMDAASTDPWGSALAEATSDDPLSAPPTDEELREIRGSFLAPFIRPMIGAVVAALVGGFAVAALFSGPEKPVDATTPSQSTKTTYTVEVPTPSTGQAGKEAHTAANPGKTESLVLFQTGEGFVDKEGVARAKAAQAEADRIASASPQEDTARFWETPQATQDTESPRASPASPRSAPRDFDWDDLR